MKCKIKQTWYTTKIAQPFFLVFLLAFSSCKKEVVEDPIPNPITSGCPIVNVTPDQIGVTISTPTIWTTGNVYVIKANVTITSVLTIEPGVIIKLNNAKIRVIDSGKINAIGTASSRITFTSLADDSYCGDSNGDGTLTAPQKGDWISIQLSGGTLNTFNYCDFLYAGQNDGGYNNSVLVDVNGSSFNFDNCVFAHTFSTTNSTAYTFYAGSYMIDNTVSQFTNNAFYDNDRPIYLNSYYTLNPNNIFHNPSNPIQTNSRNGIFLTHYTNPANASVSWNVNEVPYIMDVFFNGGGSGATGTVNIGPNVIVKFTNSSAGISKGNSRFVTIGAGAIFTSIKDDIHGGDTNGDGNTSTPMYGDWDGYWDYSSGSYISGSYIYYAAH